MVLNISALRKPGAVTAEWLRERLADTRLPENPLNVTLPPGIGRWPAALRESPGTALTPAGVLIPILERAGDLSVLLTQRSAALKHHAGQISFPGGSMEEQDRDVAMTAIRETQEEVGIDPQHVSVIGYLGPMPTITGYAVTPIVGLVSAAAELVIDRSEVEFAFEVPLEFLLDARNDKRVEREFEGHSVAMVEFHYEQRRIWGATAHMVLLLRQYLINK